MILDIVRHAETFSNAEGRLQGSTDPLLSILGVSQAENLSMYLEKDYDIIFCSSMKRTQQTLALALGKSIEDSTTPIEQFGKIMVSDHLREMNLGKLEGIVRSEMNSEQKKMWKALEKDLNFTDHNGEAPIKFYNKVNQFFKELRSLSEVPEFDRILIVTHNGVLQLIFKYILNIDAPIIHNSDVLTFELTPSSFIYMGLNLIVIDKSPQVLDQYIKNGINNFA